MTKATVEQRVQQLMDLEAQTIQLVDKQRWALDALQAAAQARLEAYRRVHGLLQEQEGALGAVEPPVLRASPKLKASPPAKEILSAIIGHMDGTSGHQSVRAIHRRGAGAARARHHV